MKADADADATPERERPEALSGEENPVEDSGEELRQALKQRDALQERLLRALAEGDNYRKRVHRELSEARAHAAAEAVRPFLAVLDGLDRAAQHAATNPEEVRRGLDLLQRQAVDAARKVGLEPIVALDQAFDPHQHEAIEMVEAPQTPSHTVLEELQRGYRLHGKLIRPALVKVAK